MPDNAPIDFVTGLRRCFGRQDILAKLLHRFVTEYQDHGQRIVDALAAGHTHEAAVLAHSLVSTAGSTGAEALSHMARALHDAIAAGDARHTLQMASELQAEQQRVCACAKTWLDAHA